MHVCTCVFSIDPQEGAIISPADEHPPRPSSTVYCNRRSFVALFIWSIIIKLFS